MDVTFKVLLLISCRYAGWFILFLYLFITITTPRIWIKSVTQHFAWWVLINQQFLFYLLVFIFFATKVIIIFYLYGIGNFYYHYLFVYILRHKGSYYYLSLFVIINVSIRDDLIRYCFVICIISPQRLLYYYILYTIIFIIYHLNIMYFRFISFTLPFFLYKSTMRPPPQILCFLDANSTL